MAEQAKPIVTQPVLDEILRDFDEKFSPFIDLQSRSTIVLDAAKELRELKELEIEFLGKKSSLAIQLKTIGSLDPKSRRGFAMEIQRLQRYVTGEIAREIDVRQAIISRLSTERDSLDVTIPGRRSRPGHLHPITLMRQRIEDIFVSLGYIVEDDREIETDFYNFDALNIPEGHPARDPQDT
ncbi:MAG TPA: hypothetical protein VF397_01135, partial [Pyrinomonadaceae bacterium]